MWTILAWLGSRRKSLGHPQQVFLWLASTFLIWDVLCSIQVFPVHKTLLCLRVTVNNRWDTFVSPSVSATLTWGLYNESGVSVCEVTSSKFLVLYVTWWKDILLELVFKVASRTVLSNHIDLFTIGSTAHTQLGTVFPHHLGKMAWQKTQ